MTGAEWRAVLLTEQFGTPTPEYKKPTPLIGSGALHELLAELDAERHLKAVS